jgi:hypothetical protein
MSDKQKTRVAITRCDTHAYWFGVFMDEPDIEVLHTYDKQAPTREAVHLYFRDGTNVKKLKIEQVPGFVISKVYDKVERLYGDYPGRAEEFCRTFPSGPKVCDDFDDLLVDIDAAYLADSSGPPDGADHLDRARPFLEKGIPVMVDKPFASTYADARQMVRLAKEYDTPLMNASILAHTDVGKAFQRRFDEIGQPGMIVVKGVGPGNSGTVHGLALAQGLIGYGVDWVESMGSHANECILLHYPSGLEAFVINAPNAVFPRTCTFYCSAYSNQGAIHCPGIGDPEFHTGTRRIVELFRQMVDTGKPPIPYEHILEPIAIIEAAHRAQNDGRRVMLSEVYEA